MGTEAGLRRTVGLLANFRYEQREPARYYRPLAHDTVAQLTRHGAVPDGLAGRVVVDVGGGPGYTAEAFRQAGAALAVTVDADRAELFLHGRTPVEAVVASGLSLPFADESIDVVCTSNTLEHVRQPWQLLGELVRVTKVGGALFIGVTNWYSPWGGHETSPWHYLGGQRALRHYARRHGHPPKNCFGDSLFPVHVGDVLRWARNSPDVTVLDAVPRYYPSWTRPILKVPGVREVFTWNLALVLRRI